MEVTANQTYECTCAAPQPHTRPSSAVVCLMCGLPIVVREPVLQRP